MTKKKFVTTGEIAKICEVSPKTVIAWIERKQLRNAKKAARRKSRQEKLADEKLISRLQPGLGLNNPYEKRKQVRQDR